MHAENESNAAPIEKGTTAPADKEAAPLKEKDTSVPVEKEASAPKEQPTMAPTDKPNTEPVPSEAKDIPMAQQTIKEMQIPEKKEGNKVAQKDEVMKENAELEDDEDEDSDEGWITPDNIENGIYFGREMIGQEQVKKKKEDVDESLKMAVGILTSDFPMQNVILQIGIPLFSFDGLRVSTIKQFVFRCRACLE